MQVWLYHVISCRALREARTVSAVIIGVYSPLGICLLFGCLVRWSVFLSAAEMHSSVFILKSLLLSSLPLPLLWLPWWDIWAVQSYPFYFCSLQKPVWRVTVGEQVILSAWLSNYPSRWTNKCPLDLGSWRKVTLSGSIFSGNSGENLGSLTY